MPQGEPAGSQGECDDILASGDCKDNCSSGSEEPPASAKVQSGASAGPPIGVKKRPPKKRRRGPAATAAAAAKTLRALLHAEHPNVALRGHSKAVGSAVRFLRKLSNSPGRSASLPWEYAHARFRAALAAEEAEKNPPRRSPRLSELQKRDAAAAAAAAQEDREHSI